MNFFKELPIHNDSSFFSHLAGAEEQKEKISSLIFDRENIIKFNMEYEVFSEENLSLILNAADEILCDEGYVSLCCALYYFIKNDISVSGLKPPSDGTLKSEFALLPPLIANMADFCENAKKRGVSTDVLSTTLQAVNMYLNANERRAGRVGSSGYHTWLPLYAQGKLFRIGVFQFEIRIFRGEYALGVHIPNGTKLDVAENIENFCAALDFFKKYYGEYDFKGFVCESWLLNPHIESIMGRKTNITRFGDMFDRFETDEEEYGVYNCVFKVLNPKNIDELCEETSLQRNIKKYIKDGNSFIDYGGFITLERLEKIKNAL